MIYKREFPNTPSKRFRTTLLNPCGSKITKLCFYKTFQKTTAKHFGKKTCLRKKKTKYKTKFNLINTTILNKTSVILQIDIARRYKTFVGLLCYSNGAMVTTPVYNGAFLGNIVKTFSYIKTPKIYKHTALTAGTFIPIAYLSIMTCIFNIMINNNYAMYFCKAAGTFCVIIRYNMDKAHCTIKLPTNKFKIINETAYVILGRNSNILPRSVKIGKAGINILKGFRPSVRGVAKNPVDHPHGGRTKTNSPERTPWGKIAKNNK